MSDKTLNIKSSTLEKGLDIVKDFVDKLISPSVSELGALLADNVKFYRGKNQIKILQRAKEYVDANNINVKQIPLKILVPFLENASLEEDDEMQDKWATMLGNMADTEQNLQNQVFPYILSQISTQEYSGLKELKSDEEKFVQNYTNLKKEYKDAADSRDWKLANEISNKLKPLNLDSGFSISLKEYEIANQIRLGLIMAVPPPIYINELSVGGSEEITYQEDWVKPQAEYDGLNDGYKITELGRLFLQLCEQKEEKT